MHVRRYRVGLTFGDDLVGEAGGRSGDTKGANTIHWQNKCICTRVLHPPVAAEIGMRAWQGDGMTARATQAMRMVEPALACFYT